MNVYQDAKSTKGKSKAQKVIDTGMWEEKVKAQAPDLHHLWQQASKTEWFGSFSKKEK